MPGCPELCLPTALLPCLPPAASWAACIATATCLWGWAAGSARARCALDTSCCAVPSQTLCGAGFEEDFVYLVASHLNLPICTPTPWPQALYPWRRVLREMFHHDRQLGQVYCLRGTDPVVVRQGRRYRRSSPGPVQLLLPGSRLLLNMLNTARLPARPAHPAHLPTHGPPPGCDGAGAAAAGGRARLCAVAPPAGRRARAAADGCAALGHAVWGCPCKSGRLVS